MSPDVAFVLLMSLVILFKYDILMKMASRLIHVFLNLNAKRCKTTHRSLDSAI